MAETCLRFWSRPAGRQLPLPLPLLLVPSLVLLLSAASCTSTKPCKNDTLLISVTLDAAAAMSDKLAVAVSIAGGAPTTTNLDHTPGQTSGSVEIDFPAGYPKGQMVTVSLTATHAGAAVGSGTATKLLSDGCEAITISVTGGGGGAGGSTGAGGVDGGGAAGTTGTGGRGGAIGTDGGIDVPGVGGVTGSGGLDGGVGTGGRATGGTTGTGGTGAGGATGCTVGQTVCGGVCVNSATDRAHCGTACAVCAATEVCANTCVTASAPGLNRVPLDPAGWLDPAGAALSVAVRNVGYSNAIYECRTGPDAIFTATIPAWAPCDGATGVGVTHTPVPNPTTPEGNYRTEHRYRADTYISPVLATRYYVHHSLDKVLLCPRTGFPNDGPHFTDLDYFTAAQAYATANPTAGFTLTTTFPLPGAIPARTDPIYLRNPFIRIPFVGVSETSGMYASIPVSSTAAWPTAGSNYIFNERSLRHAWVLNAARTMVLMKRRYVSPAPTSNCLQQFRDGHNFVGGDYLAHLMNCEALVMNTQGKGICLNSFNGTLLPVPVEQPVTGVGTVTATLNSGAILGTGTNFLNTAGRFIQIPAVGGRYYKIAATPVPTATTITVSPVFAGTTGGGQPYRVAGANTIVMPAGFAKMHPDAHQYATGAHSPFLPSPKTKCEAVGCNTGRPWMIYLSP